MKGHFKKNFILYAIIGLFSLYSVNNVNVSDGSFKFMETSLVSILENVAQSNKFEPVDLGIQNVTLKKISDPTPDFHYYKYVANIVIKNFGGDLKNGDLILRAGSNQKHNFVKNDTEGFSLAKNQVYIIENYEILFDENYNGGKLTIELKLPEKTDYFLENNKFEVNIFELPPKIQSLSVAGIKNDDIYQLSFDPLDYNILNNGFEIYTSNSLNFDDEDARYAETVAGDKILGYYRIKNSEKLIKNGNWSLMQGTDGDPHFIKFAKKPFEDDAAHYIYLKSTDPASGNYIISNIIEVVPQKSLNRETFANLFAGYTGTNLDVVKKDDATNTISRGEVLKIVTDNFNIDLAKSVDHQLMPNLPATKNYLKYLIYEYKKNS